MMGRRESFSIWVSGCGSVLWFGDFEFWCVINLVKLKMVRSVL